MTYPDTEDEIFDCDDAVLGATRHLVCCCRAKLLSPLSSCHVFAKFTHTGRRASNIHLSSDGIYIKMTNLFLSPDDGLGLHVKTQVKSGRQ